MRPLCSRSPPNNVLRQRVFRRTYHPYSWLDDAGLFCRDLFDGMSQKIFMIEIDLRNDGHFRNDHIRRIEPPAETDLDHGDIDTATHEMQKADGRGDLEKCWL